MIYEAFGNSQFYCCIWRLSYAQTLSTLNWERLVFLWGKCIRNWIDLGIDRLDNYVNNKNNYGDDVIPRYAVSELIKKNIVKTNILQSLLDEDLLTGKISAFKMAFDTLD